MKRTVEPGDPVKIGQWQARNNVFCAPLAGYTDFAFRKQCYRFGAGLCFTEMVSAKGLLYNNAATKILLHRYPGERDTAAQLFGSDPQILREACESENLREYEMIDLNMGCPVPKVFKNGEGSALLGDFALAERIIAACKKSGKRVSVKFRIGLKRGDAMASEFAKLCEGAGADMITVHGSTRDMYYAGEPDFAQIAAAKSAVSIPVIANGGIFTRADAQAMLERTGADGVMLARAAMYDPHVFSEVLGFSGEWDVARTVREQIADMLPVYGEKFTLVQMRKMAAFYLRGRRGSAQYRGRLFSCGTLEELDALLDEIFAAEEKGAGGEKCARND